MKSAAQRIVGQASHAEDVYRFAESEYLMKDRGCGYDLEHRITRDDGIAGYDWLAGSNMGERGGDAGRYGE